LQTAGSNLGLHIAENLQQNSSIPKTYELYPVSFNVAPILPILASATLYVSGRNEISNTIPGKREVDESAGGTLSETHIMHQLVSLTIEKRRLSK
jgi:hypothetical protein